MFTVLIDCYHLYAQQTNNNTSPQKTCLYQSCNGIPLCNNYVCNGDFEQRTCPLWQDNIYDAFGWAEPNTATSDYFNVCSAGPNVSVPSNIFGYQFSHSAGDGYAGLLSKDYYYNWYEYMYSQLKNSLIAGQKYKIEMWVSLSSNSLYMTDAMGIKFIDTIICNTQNSWQYDTVADVSNNLGILSDTNWTLISGIYLANGTEKYIMIGNFTLNPVLVSNPNAKGNRAEAYYYIDDVSVVPYIEIVADTFQINCGGTATLTVEIGINSTFLWNTGDVSTPFFLRS